MYTADLFSELAKDRIQNLLHEAETTRQLRVGKTSFKTRFISKFFTFSKRLEPKRLRNRYAA